MKKLITCLLLITSIALAEDKVLIWDDITPFPFGGDFRANGSVPLTGDGNAGGHGWTNLNNVIATNELQANSLKLTGGNADFSTGEATNISVMGFTNGVTQNVGALNGTNGIYWTCNETNYWLLFSP